jgi:hypothetical protein
LRGGATKNFRVRIGSTTSWYQLASGDAGIMQLSYDGLRRRRVVRVVRDALSREGVRELIKVPVHSGSGDSSNETFMTWMRSLHAALRDGRTTVAGVREAIYGEEYVGGRLLMGFVRAFIKEHPEYYMLQKSRV